jgi:hypothetical protein
LLCTRECKWSCKYKNGTVQEYGYLKTAWTNKGFTSNKVAKKSYSRPANIQLAKFGYMFQIKCPELFPRYIIRHKTTYYIRGKLTNISVYTTVHKTTDNYQNSIKYNLTYK